MKCDMCTQLRSSLTDNVLNGVRYHTERIRRLYLQHIKDVRAERGAYWARRRYACEFPEQKLSIIIDGSDQINNGCPWYRTKTHAMEGCWSFAVVPRFILLITAFTLGCYKFRLHIYGVLVHGQAPRVFLIQDHVEQGHPAMLLQTIQEKVLKCMLFSDIGANITIECLQQTLRALQLARQEFPPHLDLQLDNTTKQNKNKYFSSTLTLNLF